MKKKAEKLLEEFEKVDLIGDDDIPTDVFATLEDVAKEFLDIPTLKTRNSDGLDFHDVSVWSLRTALYQAYGLGQASMENAIEE